MFKFEIMHPQQSLKSKTKSSVIGSQSCTSSQVKLFFEPCIAFLYKFGPFAYNLCGTKQASQLVVDGPVHQLSILLSSVVKAIPNFCSSVLYGKGNYFLYNNGSSLPLCSIIVFLKRNSVVNKHSVITNKFLGPLGHFSTQITSAISNPCYNEQKWPVPRYSI